MCSVIACSSAVRGRGGGDGVAWAADDRFDRSCPSEGSASAWGTAARVEDEPGDGFGGIESDLRHDGEVGVSGESDARVAQHVLDDFQVGAGLEGEAANSVPESYKRTGGSPLSATSLVKVRVRVSSVIGRPRSVANTYPPPSAPRPMNSAC